MKQTDLRILRHLRENSRTSLTTISRKTGIPVSTIFDKIRGYESGCVHKFTALIDFAKLGYTVRAHILLRVDPQHRDKLRGYLLAHGCVNTIQRVNNGFDFAAECVFYSIKESEEFIESVEMQFGILGKQVFHIIDDVAREKLFTE